MTPSMTSIWAATADPPPEMPPLTESIATDVAIVGGGLTGLAAALRLAEAGVNAAVIDAGEPGAAASGRNGGQVIPGLKYDPDKLDEIFGEPVTAFAGQAADLVFALIEKYKIACDPVRAGWIQAAMKRAHLPVLSKRAEQWARRGASVEVLDKEQIRILTGSDIFAGGWIDRRGGSIHPLNYVRGLLRASISAGAKVYGHTRALGLTKNSSRWIVKASTGATIAADELVIATNGYTDDFWPRLKETVIPANSFQIATVPLEAGLLRNILPTRSVVSDSRRIANYFRIGPQGRLLMGGRGAFAEPKSIADYAALPRAIRRIFPKAADVPVEHCWVGRVALTRDFLPHLHQPFPNVTIALGYNGRGVAMASAVGTQIGSHLIDRPEPLPLKLSDIKPLPFHSLHRQYATLMIHYYRLRDFLER
jgi:glycine/D-amino acid oxidase-like deaminating enzyme